MGGRKLTEENIDEFIEELKNRTKGPYINQGVAFNKSCKRQMALLRCALLESTSFSGLIKEMLAVRFSESEKRTTPAPLSMRPLEQVERIEAEEQPVQRDYSGWV